MSDAIKLTPRLQAAVDMLRDWQCVADIGTDHGYVPVYLAQTQRAGRIIAADVKSGPLDSARRSAARFGVRDKIEFMLTDGFEGMEDIGLEAAILAGMGGETIMDILDMSPWVHTQGLHLVLQPQTKLEDLSVWLDNNGYAIEDEVLVKDSGRIYAVLLVRAGESRAPLSCAELYADRILMEKRDPLLPEYLDDLILRFGRSIDGMSRSINGARADELEHMRRALDGLQKMKEETEKW